MDQFLFFVPFDLLETSSGLFTGGSKLCSFISFPQNPSFKTSVQNPQSTAICCSIHCERQGDVCSSGLLPSEIYVCVYQKTLHDCEGSIKKLNLAPEVSYLPNATLELITLMYLLRNKIIIHIVSHLFLPKPFYFPFIFSPCSTLLAFVRYKASLLK